MKNQLKKYISFVIPTFALALSGCWLFDEDAEVSASVVTATKDIAASASDSGTESGTIFEVLPTTKSITISGLTSGKNVYLAKVNTSSATVSTNYQRTVKDSSGVARSALGEETLTEPEISVAEGKFKHFHGEKVSLEKLQKAARAATGTTVVTTPSADSKISGELGEERKIYVDDDVNLNSYSQKTATLRAIGLNCYVWVISDDYTKTQTTDKMKEIAETFRDKFEAFYPIETNVFGKESDMLIASNSSATKLSSAASLSMSDYSATGTKINIVIYDIGADYDSKTQCGVLGYFYAKDYFSRTSGTGSVVDYSNQGKYFYIDAYYAVNETNTTISTLVHEFQHMINYGVKDIEKDITPDTAYNEMLSMLCEDMMADYLGLGDDESVKAERLPYFNTSYFLSGIREYRNDGYAALSYSTSYGFGSWLCRQYGGAALVNAIMSNDYVDNDSLVSAVNSVNGKNYTFDDLFKQFLIACTSKDGTYTHNKDAAQTVTYGSGDSAYTYPMTKINLWSSAYSYPTEQNGFLVSGQENAAYKPNQSAYTGPFLWSTSYGLSLRPNYGILLYQLGTTSDDTLTLTFSDSGSSYVNMYVIVQ